MSDEKNANLLDRRTFFLGTAGALALGTTACGGGSGGSSFSPIGGAAAQQAPQQQTPAAVAGADSPGTPDSPAPEPTTPEPTVHKIVHPGLLVTEDDLQRIREARGRIGGGGGGALRDERTRGGGDQKRTHRERSDERHPGLDQSGMHWRSC